MGLIKAAVGAAGGALADSWREFFYCDALDQNTLAVKGSKVPDIIILIPPLISASEN